MVECRSDSITIHEVPSHEFSWAKQLPNFIAAFGNNEIKSLLLILMEDHQGPDRLLTQAQGDSPVWKSNSFHVYRHIFPRYSLVMETDAGIKKTDLGKKAEAVAGLFLLFSLNNPEHSLYNFFGTITSKNQDQESFPIRINVLSALAGLEEGKSCRVEDLAKSTGFEPGIISRHLDSLVDSGFISLDSRGRSKSFVNYAANLAASPSFRTNNTMSKFIYEILENNQGRFVAIPEIVEELKKQEVFSEITNLQVAKLLARLAKKGFVLREKFSQQEASRIVLEDGTKKMFSDLTTLLSLISNGDEQTLKLGKEAADMIKDGRWQENIKLLIKKAREKSPNVNSTSKEEMNQDLTFLLSTKPSLTTREVNSILNKKFRKKMAIRSVYDLLRELEEKGVVSSEKSKGILRWSLI
jgi:predicted transcriptional regulator